MDPRAPNNNYLSKPYKELDTNKFLKIVFFRLLSEYRELLLKLKMFFSLQEIKEFRMKKQNKEGLTEIFEFIFQSNIP